MKVLFTFKRLKFGCNYISETVEHLVLNNDMYIFFCEKDGALNNTKEAKKELFWLPIFRGLCCYNFKKNHIIYLLIEYNHLNISFY